MKIIIGIAFWLLLLVTQAATAQVQNQGIENPLSSSSYRQVMHDFMQQLNKEQILTIGY